MMVQVHVNMDESERLKEILVAIVDHGITTWPNTACGRGGVAGQAFTTNAHALVIEHLALSALDGKTLKECADEYEKMVPGTVRLDHEPVNPRNAGPDGRPI